MTITLKPWMTVLAVGVVCVLAGLVIGQVTTAQSAKDAAASARATAVQDRAVLKEMRNLNRFMFQLALPELRDIRTNTGKVCLELAGSPVCQD